MYYAVFLFQQAGIAGTQASLLANGIEGVVLNVFTWINMWYIDSWGRRRPMIIGAIGMAISMMLIGVIMKTEGLSCKLMSFPEPSADLLCQAILSTILLLKRQTSNSRYLRLRMLLLPLCISMSCSLH